MLEEMSCEASDNIDISSNIEAEGIEDAENEIISQASTTDSLEEFDFSREDPIDKYDSYTKKPLNGIEYVYIGNTSFQVLNKKSESSLKKQYNESDQ